MTDMNDNKNNPRIVYADIIDRPHHQAANRNHMSLYDRAAQFAPFAALVGYDEMVREEARLTDLQIDPGESDLDRLDRKFRRLASLLADHQRPFVSVLLFVPDARKSGGRYETVTGTARRLDEYEKKLILLGSGSPAREISLDLDRILDLSGDCLEDED